MQSAGKELENQHKTLLEKYQPILHFAKHERFFPMCINDFLAGCVLKNERGEIVKGPELTSNDLKNSSQKHYLHYVHENRWKTKIRWLFFVPFLLMFALIWYSAQPAQFDLTTIGGDLRDWPPLWNPIDNLKMPILGFILLSWPFLRGNRLVHFALFLTTAIILFVGTFVGVGFGLMASLVIAAILISKFSNRLSAQIRDHDQNKINLLKLVTGFIAALIIPVAIYGVVLFLGNRLRYNVPLENIPTLDPVFSVIPVPFDFVAMISLVIIVGITGLLFWSVLARLFGMSFRQIGGRTTSLQQYVSIDREVIPGLVLLAALIMLFLIGLFLKRLGLFSVHSHGRSLAFALLAVTATSAFFWFFTDPLTFTEKETNPSGEVKKLGQQINQNIWMISISLGGFVVWFAFSLYLALTRLEVNEFDPTGETIVWLSLFSILFVGLTVFIAMGLSGSQLPGFVMSLRSRKPDTVANRAKLKYEKSLRDKKNDEKYWYHGRVVSDDYWIMLQYHYFYAYNDWRDACGGINEHEGDWEAAAVFLKKPERQDREPTPFGVACSQHMSGEFRFWEEVCKPGEDHPNIYVAQGSHANYFEKGTFDAKNHLSGGITREIVEAIDSIVGNFRRTENGLPEEYATGEGGPVDKLNCHLITDGALPWISFRGLWGNETGHPNESGPTGPMCERMLSIPKEEPPDEISKPADPAQNKLKIRPRWQLHTWKDILLLEIMNDPEIENKKRRKALQHLVSTSEYIL